MNDDRILPYKDKLWEYFLNNTFSQFDRARLMFTIGELIDALEKLPDDIPVRFDRGGSPGELDSYRGCYEDLAFQRGKKITVGELLTECKSMVGKTIMGYKGGAYTMHRSTPVWVSEWGESSGIGLVGHEEYPSEKGRTFILTTREINP